MAFCISDPPRAIFVFGFQYGLRASQSSTAIWIRDYAHGESHDRLVLLSEAWLDERRMQMKLAEPQYDLAEKSSIMDKLSLESKAMAAPNKMGTMIQKLISKNKGNQILQRTGSSRERQCEICGKIARNITGIEDSRIVMGESNEMRLMRSATDSSGSEGSCQCRHSLCNFLLAGLVLLFIIPWFYRVDMD
ncbi:hypothetical protein U1Q18_024762 [Sarracenia purpurea var. burkii]